MTGLASQRTHGEHYLGVVDGDIESAAVQCRCCGDCLCNACAGSPWDGYRDLFGVGGGWRGVDFG